MLKIYSIILLCFISYTISEHEVKLLNQLITENPNENVIISPIGLFQIISLLSNGAVLYTKYQLLDIIGQNQVVYANMKNKDYLQIMEKQKGFTIANAILTKFEPNENFLKKAEIYQATIGRLESAKQVNDWCAAKTNNKITHLVDDVSNSDMMLLNAVYFKGVWATQFDPSNTHEAVFHSPKGDQKVQMMTNTFEAHFIDGRREQIIKLPYTEKGFFVTIVLPSGNIDDYLSTMRPQIIANKSYGEPQKVKLSLPKFELSFGQSLVEAMKRLECVDAFDVNKADFSGITEHMKLVIGEIIHKTYLKFDEEGTEAAVVTSISMERAMPMEKDEAVMTVDTPFIVLISHEDMPKSSLFLAKIASIN